MSVTAYVKSHLGEFVLVLASAFCLACVAENAFFLSTATARVPVTLAASFVLTVALFAINVKPGHRVFGACIYIVLVAALVALALFFSTGKNIYTDAEGNYLYLALCIAFASTAAYLLSRSLPGSAIWFLASVFICSTVQAFYEFNALAASLGAGFASLALIIHRNFQLGIAKADTAESTSHLANFGASILPVIAAGLVAVVVWFGVIAPLSPGVLKISLITDYRQLPIEEQKGVANTVPTLNLEMVSNKTTDGYYYTTDDLLEGASNVLIDARQMFNQAISGTGSGSSKGENSGTEGALDKSSLDQKYNAQSYLTILPVIIVVLAIIAGIILLAVLLFLLRRHLRRRRLLQMLEQEPRAQMFSLYLFLLERLRRLGFTVPAGKDLLEFAQLQQQRMSVFDVEAKVLFTDLTATYLACTFSDEEPTEEDIVPFIAYYLSFWKAARKFLGNVKYFFKSFRL